MTSIGRRCKGGDVRSRAVLIARYFRVLYGTDILAGFSSGAPFNGPMSREMSPLRREGKRLKVAMARGIHLFPSRTEKLSLAAPMVLRIVGE